MVSSWVGSAGLGSVMVSIRIRESETALVMVWRVWGRSGVSCSFVVDCWLPQCRQPGCCCIINCRLGQTQRCMYFLFQLPPRPVWLFAVVEVVEVPAGVRDCHMHRTAELRLCRAVG